jgi:hypothetical protein
MKVGLIVLGFLLIIGGIAGIADPRPFVFFPASTRSSNYRTPPPGPPVIIPAEMKNFYGIASVLVGCGMLSAGIFWNRVASIDPEPKPPPPSAKQTDDDFSELGGFEPFEAERILKRFETEHVRFQIDTQDIWSWGGRGGPSKTSKIKIFVHHDDAPKAAMILNEDSKV